VKKAKGSELPGAKIAFTATGIPMIKRTATWLEILRHAKEKGQIEYDLTFLAKVLPPKKLDASLFRVTGRTSACGHYLLFLSASPQSQSSDQ